MSASQVPHYKTLDIIKFYNQVYDFVSRYLIFVLAGVFAIILMLIVRIREPDTINIPHNQGLSGSIDKGYIQETGLIYPVNYFAQGSFNFDGDNKILGLGGPIWRNQGMWNSIDNIVQYNGVILPRQISRSAWVPKLQQEYYSESMIKTFLEGMSNSQADINTIKLAMDTITKQSLSGDSISDRFGVGCSMRPLLITKFCDLKLLDAIEQRSDYDLSESTAELKQIYEYLFVDHPNQDIQKSRCTTIVQQYRYSAHPGLASLTKGCSKQITDEVAYIGNMASVNQEVRSNKFTNNIYEEPSINRYKLMSWYQYLMPRAISDQFTDEDANILTTYNSYIIKLANKGTIVQPYGDIIAVFHQQYLIPWLSRRDSFAKSNEKDLTQTLIATTETIINGDAGQNIISVTSGSKIKPIDFLISQGLYYGDDTGNTTEKASDTTASQTGNQINTSTGSIIATGQSSANTPPTQATTSTPDSSLDALISQVLGTTPTSTPIKRGQTIIIKYNYKGAGWIAAVELGNQGATQLYYDSPLSGATKITHPKVIFNTSNKELIIAIMNNHLNTNPQ